MTESRIPELLAKLEKLDWETYRKYRASMNIGGVILEGEVTLYLLQGVIQDAIAARHGWALQTYMSGKKQECRISTGSYYWLTGEGNTPAEALLAAYVAALEAQG